MKIYICRQYSHVGYTSEMFVTKYPLLAREWAKRAAGVYTRGYVDVYDVSGKGDIEKLPDECFIEGNPKYKEAST